MPAKKYATPQEAKAAQQAKQREWYERNRETVSRKRAARYATDEAFRSRQQSRNKASFETRVAPLIRAVVEVLDEASPARLPAIVRLLKQQAETDGNMRKALRAPSVDNRVGHLLEDEA